MGFNSAFKGLIMLYDNSTERQYRQSHRVVVVPIIVPGGNTDKSNLDSSLVMSAF